MDNLEKYVRENSREFDIEEPAKGHFERFALKLDQRRRSRSSFRWRYMLQVAVIAVLVILSSLWIYDRITGRTPEYHMITLSDISGEYREAELYYTTLISRKYNEIKSFDFQDDTREQEVLLRELSEMDAVYRSLQQELNAEGDNPMVINAMLRYYQLKLEIMSRIIEHLQEIKQGDNQTTDDHETSHV
ncbi:MAG: hypothetical protein EA408_02895 [Marinilabiliales bacterium]|nr:MAG: hypothetical protein EA408_02895 [Marinilabiliales bacterium]